MKTSVNSVNRKTNLEFPGENLKISIAESGVQLAPSENLICSIDLHFPPRQWEEHLSHLSHRQEIITRLNNISKAPTALR